MPFYDHILLIRLGLDRWAAAPRRRLTHPIRLRAARPAPAAPGATGRRRPWWRLHAVLGALNRSA